jgi:hypothetical protein
MLVHFRWILIFLYTFYRFCTVVLIQLISTKRFGNCTLRNFFQD